MSDPLNEIRDLFFIECGELLDGAHEALVILDDRPSDPDQINAVFRAVHSIKGGAAAFGFVDLVEFAHRLESVLDALRARKLTSGRDVVQLVTLAMDELLHHVEAARLGSRDTGPDNALLSLESLLPRGGAEVGFDFHPLAMDMAHSDWDGGAVPVGWHITFRPHAELYRSGNDALMILRDLASLGSAIVTCQVVGDLTLDPAEVETPVLSWQVELHGDVSEEEVLDLFEFVQDVCDLTIVPLAEKSAANEPLPPIDAPMTLDPEFLSHSAAAPPATIRVDVDKVDRLVDLVGELVINQSMLAQAVADAGIHPQNSVAAGLDEFLTLTRDIQDSVMKIRAQPVRSLFQRMGRVLRETAAMTGKTVAFRTDGEGTEVDKTLIERLVDPLTHMVRNAVDHGLEDPDRRAAAGKPDEGVVTLSAAHRAGRIVITLSDDGAGIDRDRVRRTAIRRGVIASDAQLSDAETDHLLFLPGFSTTEHLSSVSGRGVGMDIVSDSVRALGGEVTIASEPGQGTIFSISLPLTLAVLDGMIVRVAGQTLVIPLSAIVETAIIHSNDIRRVGAATEMLQLRTDVRPLSDLGVRLGFRARQDISAHHGRVAIMTTRDGCDGDALIVDEILDQRQVVIKGLGGSVGQFPGVAAATILGNGRVALIIDPAGLSAMPPPCPDRAFVTPDHATGQKRAGAFR